jgi:hypothetical protein
MRRAKGDYLADEGRPLGWKALACEVMLPSAWDAMNEGFTTGQTMLHASGKRSDFGTLGLAGSLSQL